MPDESFGDIGHDRDSRALNLPTQTKVLLPSLAQANRFVDLPRQLSGFFPTIEVLESGELPWSGLSRRSGLSCLFGLSRRRGLFCFSSHLPG